MIAYYGTKSSLQNKTCAKQKHGHVQNSSHVCAAMLLVQKWCRAQWVYIGRHPPRLSFAELKICTTDIPPLAMFIPNWHENSQGPSLLLWVKPALITEKAYQEVIHMMRQQTWCLKVCKLWRLWVKPAIFSTPHPPSNFRELIFISIFRIVMKSTTMMFLVSAVVSLLPKNLLQFRELQSLLKACISSAALDSFIKMCTFNKSGHVEQSTSSKKINGF